MNEHDEAVAAILKCEHGTTVCSEAGRGRSYRCPAFNQCVTDGSFFLLRHLAERNRTLEAERDALLAVARAATAGCRGCVFDGEEIYPQFDVCSEDAGCGFAKTKEALAALPDNIKKEVEG